jgi:hypothetical protein
MQRRLLAPAMLAAVVLLAAVPAALALTGGQRLFGGLLLRDAKVSAQVKTLLRSQGGFVDPKILIGDLTGDKRVDAVVLVGSGGAGGDVALYIVSSDGPNGRTGTLRVAYVDEPRYRVSARVKNTVVTERIPNYAPGDDICCPHTLTERDLKWNKRAGAFRVVGTRQVTL